MKKNCTWELIVCNKNGNTYQTECGNTLFMPLNSGGKPDKCKFCGKQITGAMNVRSKDSYISV